MKRRHALFGILGLGAGLASVRHATAQRAAKVPVIGLFDTGGDRPGRWAEFRQQLRELGYVEGRNVAFEARYAGGKVEELPALAQELVRLRVAVIVTATSSAAQSAKRATSTIPIVMASGADPVGLGLVASLARPRGNVTGVTSIMVELTRKRFELLREVLPNISRLAVLWNRVIPSGALAVRELEAASRSSKVALQNLGVKSEDEITGTFAAMTKEHAGAVFVIANALFFSERRRISDLALKHRLPSYPDLFRRAAVYVDKILKGAKPGDLPIEQPTTFELVINMKTAQTLGVTIPQTILFRAERVIE